jgi:hypothetical protein
MKLSQFRTLIREEVRKVIMEIDPNSNVGDMEFPTKGFVNWMKSYLEETSGFRGAGPANNYIRSGIKNPPKTVDEFIDWWAGFIKVSKGGSGFGPIGNPAYNAADMWVDGDGDADVYDDIVDPYISKHFKS